MHIINMRIHVHQYSTKRGKVFVIRIFHHRFVVGNLLSSVLKGWAHNIRKPPCPEITVNSKMPSPSLLMAVHWLPLWSVADQINSTDEFGSLMKWHIS